MSDRRRRLTHCSVPGHGTCCVASEERQGDRYVRCTEERMAMDYETQAEGLSDE